MTSERNVDPRRGGAEGGNPAFRPERALRTAATSRAARVDRRRTSYGQVLRPRVVGDAFGTSGP
jgi:hypothetical protein